MKYIKRTYRGGSYRIFRLEDEESATILYQQQFPSGYVFLYKIRERLFFNKNKAGVDDEILTEKEVFMELL